MLKQMPQAQLLPKDRTFQQLLVPYLCPYFLFVALSSLPTGWLGSTPTQIVKLFATATLMAAGWRTYRFGRLTAEHVGVSILALPLALGAWLGPLFLVKAAGMMPLGEPVTGDDVHNTLYFGLRLFNSAILVAIFEELFMRVFVMQWFYQAGRQRQAKGLLGSLIDTLDQRPAAELKTLPLSVFSVIGTTLVFTAGHPIYAYPAAVAYFLFTTWLYKKTGSLWVLILIHGLTNLAIGLLVRYGGMHWLW
ncbi:putative Abortive infection protein [Desulfosarcina cetonica]|nr:putative Abortive infection protein [Desulfosarcina cetonica]